MNPVDGVIGTVTAILACGSTLWLIIKGLLERRDAKLKKQADAILAEEEKAAKVKAAETQKKADDFDDAVENKRLDLEIQAALDARVETQLAGYATEVRELREMLGAQQRVQRAQEDELRELRNLVRDDQDDLKILVGYVARVQSGGDTTLMANEARVIERIQARLDR